MMSHADAFIEIPMHGFAEASTSACRGHFDEPASRPFGSLLLPWQLHEDEQAVLNAEWIYKSVRHARGISHVTA